MTVLLARAFGATLLLASLAGGDRVALAQMSGAQMSGSGVAVEFSSNAGVSPGFSAPRLGRRARVAEQLAAVPAVMPQAVPASPSIAGARDGDVRSHNFEHFFLSGIALLVRGDPADAATVFEVTSGVAGEMPQMAYLLGLARVLSDFTHRDHALAAIKHARAGDPAHPLYQIVEVLADQKLSVLKADGALYLTPDGARQLRVALDKLSGWKDAYNAKYVATALAIDASNDPALPQRIGGFAALLGPGRAIVLPNIAAGQALGRLLVLSIPTERLARYEARFLTGASETRAASAASPGEPHRSDLAGRSLAFTP